MRGLPGIAAAAIVFLYGRGAGAADVTATSTASNTDTLETVVVTARKREESLAQVPISITTFSAQSLEAYNIQSFDDYATKTPNISFAYGRGPTG